MEFAEDPTVELLTANLGNRLFQFFAATALIARAGKGTVSNASFPEWGLAFPRRNPDNYRRVIIIDKISDFDITALAQIISRDGSVFVKVRHHLQKQSLYLSKDFYNALFPVISDCQTFGAKDLLINIRTGDIIGGGTHWYPLIPIRFYRDLIETTGLNPVFMGQLAACRYVDSLRAAFPTAPFLESRGPVFDFDIIRRATNIVPAISTFSLAAAWLSNAQNIYLPLSGFLNPAHMREIDLLPLADQRYRFYLFPLNFALPEAEALVHHARINGTWREISRNKLAVICGSAPLISLSSTDSDKPYAVGFNERYYVHEHIDAAMQISEGWYLDGLHHYRDIGRSLGYVPGPLGVEETSRPNLALGKRAWQSSNSVWSRGRSIEEDARTAVNGDRVTNDYFHTDLEDSPWWMVDCGADFALTEIHIYNRKGSRVLQDRARPLLVEISRDRSQWSQLLLTDADFVFGIGGDELVPLVCRPSAKTVARFVKISVPGKKTYLHLTEVEVYGVPT